MSQARFAKLGPGVPMAIVGETPVSYTGDATTDFVT